MSVPSYISGIRRTHYTLGPGELPTLERSLRLGASYAGYVKVSDWEMPSTDICISIPVLVLYDVSIWAARPRAKKRDRREAALLITATVFGLLSAGAQSILYEQTELTEDRLQVLVGSLKERLYRIRCEEASGRFTSRSRWRGTRSPSWVCCDRGRLTAVLPLGLFPAELALADEAWTPLRIAS